MQPEQALPVALVVSKSLRKRLLRGAGLAAVAGLLMIPIEMWARQTFESLQRPNDFVSLMLGLTPVGLIILSIALFFAWVRAAILAKVYRRAAEDGRDVAQELGFMGRHE
jgi:di/tricarboxylate transporter